MTIIKCNKCGKQFDEYDENAGVVIYTRLGYGSKYDGDILRLDLCCGCLDSLIDDCKISPLKEIG